jgi:hypothetical protein
LADLGHPRPYVLGELVGLGAEVGQVLVLLVDRGLQGVLQVRDLGLGGRGDLRLVQLTGLVEVGGELVVQGLYGGVDRGPQLGRCAEVALVVPAQRLVDLQRVQHERLVRGPSAWYQFVHRVDQRRIQLLGRHSPSDRAFQLLPLGPRGHGFPRGLRPLGGSLRGHHPGQRVRLLVEQRFAGSAELLSECDRLQVRAAGVAQLPLARGVTGCRDCRTAHAERGDEDERDQRTATARGDAQQACREQEG